MNRVKRKTKNRFLITLAVMFMLPLPAAAQFTVAFWGDSRSNTGSAFENICGYLIAEQGVTVDVHWQNGDFTQGGSTTDWSNSWNIPNVREACVKDYFFMCTSNHDAGSAYQGELVDILPGNGSNVYYSHTAWDIPGSQRKLHLCMFDLYMSSEQEQLDYFTTQLAGISPNDWICALWHAPSFNGMTYKTEEGGMKDQFMQFLQPLTRGGDFILNGHAHQYRRTNVLDWNATVLESTGGSGTTHTSPVDSWGIVHIVNGRGGVFSSDNSGFDWPGNAFAPTLTQTEGLITLMEFDDATVNVSTVAINSSYQIESTLDTWSWTRPDAAMTEYTLSTIASNGSISLDPAGGTYTAGTMVSLSASADEGYVFTNWSGDLSGSDNPATITIDSDKSVTANFCTGNCSADISVSASDAAEENAGSGGMYLTSSDLELPRDGTTEQLVGVNFSALSIPQGATVNSAYVQFTVDETTSGSLTLEIYGHDADSSSAFTSIAYDISSRTPTSASVNWSPPDWSTGGAAGTAQQTIDISAIIQEIVDRPGWSSGNAITIIIKRAAADGGTNTRIAGSANSAITLEVAFTTGGSTPVLLTYPVGTGWNMVSFNATPSDAAAESVFSSVTGLVIVKDGQGSVYWPEYSVNSIGDVQDGRGYKLNTVSAGDIAFMGTAIEAASPISLAAGWNLFAYYPAANMAIETATAGITADITIVKDNSGNVYWPDYSINNIGDMVVGQGYKAHMKNTAVLIYPGGSAKAAAPVVKSIALPEPMHFILYGNTGENATLLSRRVLLQGHTVPDRSEVGVHDSQGALVGSGTVIGGITAFPIRADNPYTGEKDGAKSGEHLTFRLWSQGVEYPLVLKDEEAAVYSADAIIQGELAVPEIVSTDRIALTDISPNPFYNRLMISFEVPAAGDMNLHQVKIELFSLTGRLVGVITDRAYRSGRHGVNFSAGNERLEPGVYFVRFTSGSCLRQYKVIKIGEP